jgi:hypothetical protein
VTFDLSNYVDVAARVELFRQKHPEGSLQCELLDLPPAFAQAFIAVKASAFRSPEDPRPGVEMAWEPVPGTTPYTRNSELMNACTSAIGRAIVAVLAADTKRGMASADEVRNREPQSQASTGTSGIPPHPAAPGSTRGVGAAVPSSAETSDGSPRRVTGKGPEGAPASGLLEPHAFEGEATELCYVCMLPARHRIHREAA